VNRNILHQLSSLFLALGLLLGMTMTVRAEEGAGSYRIFLPLALRAPASCAATGARYASLPINPPPTDRPAAQHPDLNLALRGYTPANAATEYIWLGGDADARAPQLTTLLSPPRRPDITGAWHVYDWDWTQNRRGDPIAAPPVTLMGLKTTPGELLSLPDSGYDLGQGYEALVLYAEPHRITLKYTREDNVVSGYTLHLENICVDPNLLALYQQLDGQGREQLPALRAGQPLARAVDSPLSIAIRDTGRFMDPRSIKDWWR